MNFNPVYQVKVHAFDAHSIGNAQQFLRKRMKFSFNRLPTKTVLYNVRKSPCGRGFATFKKATKKIHKSLFAFKNLEDLKKATTVLNTMNCFVTVRIG